MLFRQDALDGIAAGRVTLAYRSWDRPRVTVGSRLRTRIGVLTVDSVDRVSKRQITAADVAAAGFGSRAKLLAALDDRPGRTIYRVGLHLSGVDPRVELREDDVLAAADIGEIGRRLARLDHFSTHGPWTGLTLQTIREHPGTRAPDLAASLRRETKPFKVDVRKLKELGLTESLRVGYRLSPRGRAYLEVRRDTGDRI